MNTLRKCVESMPQADQELFWDEVAIAMRWRGWDADGLHRALKCHACAAITNIAALALKHGTELQEYT